jgi:hypothetical protein
VGTSSKSTRVVASTVGEVSASEVADGVGHEGADASFGTEEGQDGSVPATDAMEVDTTGQV